MSTEVNTTTAQSQSLSDLLKIQIDGHHQSIESVKRFGRMFAPDYTVAEYTELLQKFYGFFKPLEDTFQSHPDWVQCLGDSKFILAERLRTTLLEKDLLALGLSPEQVAQLPVCQKLPELSSKAQMMGCLYVLEGSTLGGQGIAKKLSGALQLAPDKGLAFYTGHGPETMPKWKAFKGVLDSSFSVEDDLPSIAQTAGATFEALANWMNAS
jgi:heme oxygenase